MAGSDLQTLQAAFRDVMAGVCTPVSVVTATSNGSPHGTTVGAFASLSMDPPMVLVSLDGGSELLALVREVRRFGLNVLRSSQSHLALMCARKGGTAKFTDIPWHMEAGVPRVAGASGFMACEVAQLVEGGDHVVVLANVLAAETAAGPPLTYHARAFGTHAAIEESAR